MDQQPGFDHTYFLNTLANAKWTVAAVVLLAVAAALVSNYFQSLRYKAWAQIQIDAPPSLPNPGTDVVSQTNYYTNIDKYFKTEKEKLVSRRMRNLFVEQLKSRSPEYRTMPAESIIKELETDLTVEPVEDTNLLTLTFKTDNPDKASDWLNLYVTQFVEQNARLQEEAVRQNRELLRRQLDDIRNLIAAQQERMTHRAESVRGADPVAGEADFIFRYESAYDEARRKRTEEEQKLEKLAAYLNPGANLSSVPAFDVAAGVRGACDRLVDARAALEKLRLDGKGEEHPAVVSRKVDIQSLQEQIRSELKKTADGMRLNITLLKRTEDAALQGYREKVAERRASSRQTEETTRLEKMRENWTNASSLVEEKLRSLEILENSVANNITIVEPAHPDPKPVSKRGAGFVLLALFSGLVLGIGLVFAGEFLNPKIKTVEEIPATLNVPALGFLPRSRDFTLNEIREAYNVLRTEILFRRDTQQHRTIMVTSSVPQEGKTTVTMNLAKTLAAAGDRTIVVDFDLRKARLRSLMSSGAKNGKNVFCPVEGLKLRLEPTETKSLHLIVPATLPEQAPFVLSQPEIRELIDYLRSEYEWILIDTPPVTAVTDPVILASIVDAILFIVKHNFVDKRIVRNSIASLNKVNANIMGAVLNDLDVRKMSHYSYQSYYRYYSDSDSKGENR